jgi:hypothetical protein
MFWSPGSFSQVRSKAVFRSRHCERSEAIQLFLSEQESWIASSLRSSQ